MISKPAPERPDRLSGFSLPESLREFSVEALTQLRDNSFDGVGISRETYGPGETAAMERVEAYARQEDLLVEWDAARNLIVRLPGTDGSLAPVGTGSPPKPTQLVCPSPFNVRL